MKSHPKSQDFYCEWLGLEPGPRPPDHYTLLGIERFEAVVTRIEDAARDRVKLVRPLCTKFPEEGTRILNEVTQAKLCLVDGELRSEYDRTLRIHRRLWIQSIRVGRQKQVRRSATPTRLRAIRLPTKTRTRMLENRRPMMTMSGMI